MKTTKEAIRNMADKLFKERGFAQVSVDDICCELGITKGSFYHHYKSKYEPFLDTMLEMYKNPATILETLRDVSSPRERTWILYRVSYYDYVKDLSKESYRILWQYFCERNAFSMSSFGRTIFTELDEYISTDIDEAQKIGEVKNQSPAADIINLLIRAGRGLSIEYANNEESGNLLDELKKTFDTVLG